MADTSQKHQPPLEIPMRILNNKRENDRKAMIAVLSNMINAIKKDNGDNELHVEMTVSAEQAWQNEPDIWTVFMSHINFSAGPNSVHSEKWPEDWERING